MTSRERRSPPSESSIAFNILLLDPFDSLPEALSIATTSCTVLACRGDDLQPIVPALLWMDSRAAPEAAEILQRGSGDSALGVNCGGSGPISAEWMLPKALWLKRRRPEVWAAATVICECQDWLQFKCTGTLVAGGCNVATRWHCHGVQAVMQEEEEEEQEEEERGKEGGGGGRFAGRPRSLLRKIGLEDLEDKWPRRCLALGCRVGGGLTAGAAAHLGLAEGTPVAQGGADFVAVLGR